MDQTTVFYGKMAAPYLLVTGLGFLLSTGFYDNMVRGNARTDPVTLNLFPSGMPGSPKVAGGLRIVQN